MISIVIPTLNAQPWLVRTLTPLVAGVAEGMVKEAIVVDGASSDETRAMAEAAGCVVIEAAADRVAQLRAGASVARGEWLLFLDQRVKLSRSWIEAIRAFIEGSARSAATFHLSIEYDGRVRPALWRNLKAAVAHAPVPEQGLLFPRSHLVVCDERKDSALAYHEFIGPLCRNGLAVLRAEAVIQRAATRESSG